MKNKTPILNFKNENSKWKPKIKILYKILNEISKGQFKKIQNGTLSGDLKWKVQIQNGNLKWQLKMATQNGNFKRRLKMAT